MSDKKSTKITVAEAIAELRSEIYRAQSESADQNIRFIAKSIEIELSVSFEREVSANGGVAKWIPFVDFAVKGSEKKQGFHKITLQLEIDTQDNPKADRITDKAGPMPVMIEE